MSCDRNQNFLTQVAGTIGKEIHTKQMVNDPIAVSVAKTGYDMSLGLSNVYTVIERPDLVEPNFQPLTASDGTNSLCEATPGAINFNGLTKKSYYLEQDARRSPDICLDDTAFSVNGQEQVSAFVQGLDSVTEWFRNRYIQKRFPQLAGNKVIATLANNGSVRTDDSVTTYPAVVATSQLTQGLLDAEMTSLNYRGGRDYAFKLQAGQPLYTVWMSAETSDAQIRNNPSIVRNYQFSSQADALLGPLGSVEATRSAVHVKIQFPRRFRFVAGAYVEVPPWVKIATDKGFKTEVNPQYLDASYATHEETVIWLKGVYELAVPDAIPMPKGLKYDPQNYVGEFMFLNIKGIVCVIAGVPVPTNLLGNTGFFYARWRYGSKMARPELATSIIHLRCGYGNDAIGCPPVGS